MNGSSSRGKISFILFNFVNVKENWTHLPEKNWQSGAKINTILRPS